MIQYPDETGLEQLGSFMETVGLVTANIPVPGRAFYLKGSHRRFQIKDTLDRSLFRDTGKDFFILKLI